MKQPINRRTVLGLGASVALLSLCGVAGQVEATELSSETAQVDASLCSATWNGLSFAEAVSLYWVARQQAYPEAYPLDDPAIRNDSRDAWMRRSDHLAIAVLREVFDTRTGPVSMAHIADGMTLPALQSAYMRTLSAPYPALPSLYTVKSLLEFNLPAYQYERLLAGLPQRADRMDIIYEQLAFRTTDALHVLNRVDLMSRPLIQT